MAEDFGSGVSRTLTALQRQFQTVVWQAGKPPLDSELNLMSQMDADRMARLIGSAMPSGFVMDPTVARRDYLTSSGWSNFFQLGRVESGAGSTGLWAVVNGWVIPVAGSSSTDQSNRIDLFPPPSSDARIDFIFLEAWQAQVSPNPSEDNKPAADALWNYGNVKFGGTNPTDDLEDPAIGFETTERVQIQYRLRVFGQGSGLGTSVSLNNFPDGLDDPNVLGQGTASGPQTGFTFANLGEAGGDPGLWRSGDGDPTNDLATVDGYTYAIPIAAIFRRNSSSFVAQTAAGNANQNGAVNRNPTSLSFSDPAEGTKTLGTATLTNIINETATGLIEIDGLVGSGFENADINWDSTFLVIDGEIISIEAVSTGTSPGTVTIRATEGRGRWGTMAVPHAVGATVSFFNFRHDGLFADQVADTDILDMRRSVNLGDWDYQRLLQHNLSKLLQGDLRSSYKQSGIGDTQGPYVVEVDTLDARGGVAVPNQTEALDGPDGIRTIFSDAATIQPDVTLLLNDPDTLASGSAGAIPDYSAGVAWGVAAEFVPSGFVVDGSGWNNGDIIDLHLGGSTGNGGARATFRDSSERAVRFVGPQEYWASTGAPEDVGRQTPVTLRFLSEGTTDPAGPNEDPALHPGPVYPLKITNFERPYLFLGGILNTASQVSGTVVVHPDTGPGDWEVELPGLDFDSSGEWFTKTSGRFNDDPATLTNPVLHASRTLWSMLTNNGLDLTGASSEVYLVIRGDDDTAPTANNGVFRVVGAGTAGYTSKDATASDRVRVEFISESASDFTAKTGLDAEFRSQHTHSEDGGGTGQAAAVIVITDIEGAAGGTANPWNGLLSQPVVSKVVVRTTLQYHPGRGGTARVGDELNRFAVVTAGSEYLRRNPSAQDSTFASSAAVPDDETFFDLNAIQAWNRLTGLGLDAPQAPAYGGEIASFTEQDRESELFVDSGSKTVMFRPYLARGMTLLRRTTTAEIFPEVYIAGHDVDGATIFPSLRNEAYALPPEFMPRFGRHDIPYFVDVAGTGAGTYLEGINHMFVDTLDETDPQFNIIGGSDQGIGGGVAPLLFQTTDTVTSSLDYGEYGPVPPGGLGSAFQCRIYVGSDVVSSDLGRGMKGIQLPAFYGVARIYGIYERTDFENAGGNTMFEPDRITPIAGAAPNLLRTDADKQTVFIVRNGADDVLAGTGNHTYVIPFDTFDVRLSDSFTGGTQDDYEYVVECVVFGFAKGFIDENNYVSARLNGGAGGGGTVAELDGAGMVFPAPAPLNDQLYIAYNRTPYQGDPYMTRDGDTRTVSDYENRYGQIPQASAFDLSEAIQQFDSNGDTIIETPNARGLQVLASLDFYTTLGTGKVGGTLFPGTPLDVGHIQNTLEAAGRVPGATTDPPWQVQARAFSASQKNNPSSAKTTLILIDNGSVTGVNVVFQAGDVAVIIKAGVAYTVAGTAPLTASNLIDAINSSGDLQKFVKAEPWDGITATVHLTAIVAGAAGNDIFVQVSDPAVFTLVPDKTEALSNVGVSTGTYLQGGVDQPANSGDGTSSLELTGLTERLPLGILVQDSDFIAEDLLRNGTSQLQSFAGGIGVTQLATPLTGGEEYTRLLGASGFLGMSDGSILTYAAFDETTQPTGTKKFRLFRGGGSAYVLSDPRPGGPVDWVAGDLGPTVQPVLKGGVLACRALLVRNFSEEAFSGGDVTSHGDEIQMVVFTRAIFGDGGSQAGLNMSGIISPTGYGEGYAAADRYRLEGYPMASSHGSVSPDTGVELAVFPFDDLTSNVEG
jgi:hypothetical protein